MSLKRHHGGAAVTSKASLCSTIPFCFRCLLGTGDPERQGLNSASLAVDDKLGLLT